MSDKQTATSGSLRDLADALAEAQGPIGEHATVCRALRRAGDEIDRLRAVEVAARDLWERRSGHRMGSADWRAPQECFWALHAALEKTDG
jgi:hypothetical protein